MQSPSDVVSGALHILREREQLEELRRDVRIGLDQLDRGESAPHDMQSIPPSQQTTTPLWRLLLAIPIYLLGGFYALMFIRTPERVAEAYARAQAVGWEVVIADPRLVESLLRVTAVPLTGVALLCVAFGIHRRTWRWPIVGGVLAIVVFFANFVFSV